MPAASSTPTPERLARGPVAPPQIDNSSFKPYWRASDRIEKLCAAGLITLREARSAAVFRELYERAYTAGGLRAADLTRVRQAKHCGKPAPTMSERQADALAQLQRIRQALGGLFIVLKMALIEEMPWSVIGRRLGIDQRTARKWVAAAIAALAAL